MLPALSMGSGLLIVSSDLISLDVVDDVDFDSLGCGLIVEVVVVVVEAEFLMVLSTLLLAVVVVAVLDDLEVVP